MYLNLKAYLFDTLSSECTFSTGCGGCCCFGFSLFRPLFVLSTFVVSGCTATGGATGLGSVIGCSFVDAAGGGCCKFATIFVELSDCEAVLPLFDCEATLCWLCAGCFAFGLCFCCWESGLREREKDRTEFNQNYLFTAIQFQFLNLIF